MSITLSPEAAAKAAAIPDFAERLERFVKHQHELEQWRSRRYSAKTCDLVERGMARGKHLQASGVSRAEIRERLMALYEKAIPLPGEDHVRPSLARPQKPQ